MSSGPGEGFRYSKKSSDSRGNGSSARNRTAVPDRRLHGVALVQQRLDEGGGDVPVPAGHARRRLLVAARHRRSTKGRKDEDSLARF